MDVKGDKSSYNFLKKASKKWDQSISETKFFSIYSQIKKLGFSAPLTPGY